MIKPKDAKELVYRLLDEQFLTITVCFVSIFYFQYNSNDSPSPIIAFMFTALVLMYYPGETMAWVSPVPRSSIILGIQFYQQKGMKRVEC